MKNSRLSADEHGEIVRLLNSGVPTRQIARQTGRAIGTIYAIRQRPLDPPHSFSPLPGLLLPGYQGPIPYVQNLATIDVALTAVSRLPYHRLEIEPTSWQEYGLDEVDAADAQRLLVALGFIDDRGRLTGRGQGFRDPRWYPVAMLDHPLNTLFPQQLKIVRSPDAAAATKARNRLAAERHMSPGEVERASATAGRLLQIYEDMLEDGNYHPRPMGSA